MSPSTAHQRRRADALHTFATAIGELRRLVERPRRAGPPRPAADPSERLGTLEQAFTAAIRAGYSRAMAFGMLGEALQPTEHADPARLVAAYTCLEQLRAGRPTP